LQLLLLDNTVLIIAHNQVEQNGRLKKRCKPKKMARSLWPLFPSPAENRTHPFSFANAAAIAPPIGACAGARLAGLPPAGLPCPRLSR
jgi:hypothetical protein